MIKVSVIIPTYNRSDALSKTLDCLSKQQFDEQWEVVVINNNSTDDTDSIVIAAQEKFPVSLSLIHEKIPGPAATRNAGVRAAQGQYIIFVDNDILTKPDFLQRHTRRLEENVGCWIVGNVVILPEMQATNFGKFIKNAFPPVSCESGLIEREGITGQTTSMLRNQFEELGGFDENFFVASGEDHELAIRARATGIKILFDPSIIVEHNDWAGSSIRDYCQRQRLYMQTQPMFWQKYGDEHHSMQLVRENLPPDLRSDGFKLFIWKNVKKVIGSNIGQAGIIKLCEIVEITLPTPVILWRLYRASIAGAIYRGFQEGLKIPVEQNKSLTKRYND